MEGTVTLLKPENFSYKTEFDSCPDWLNNLYLEERIHPYSNGVVSFVLVKGLVNPSKEEEQFKRLRFMVGCDDSHLGFAARADNILLPGDSMTRFRHGGIRINKDASYLIVDRIATYFK